MSQAQAGNIFTNFFRGNQNAQTPPSPNNAVPNNSNPAVPGNTQPNPNAIDPNNPNSQGTSDPNALQGPEVLYAKFFDDAVSNDPGQQAPKFDIDPKTMQSVTDKLDFTSSLPQEIQQKMASGEALTGQEMQQMLNHVGRQAYANAMNHSSKLTERFVGLHSEHSLKSVPKTVAERMVQSRIANNPNAQRHPVVKKQMEVIASQLLKTNPDASPEWIEEQTSEYFLNLARETNPEIFKDLELNSGEDGKRQVSRKQQDSTPPDFWDRYVEDKQ